MTNCACCKRELNSMEEAFNTYFVEFKRGIKLNLCHDCGNRKAISDHSQLERKIKRLENKIIKLESDKIKRQK